MTLKKARWKSSNNPLATLFPPFVLNSAVKFNSGTGNTRTRNV